MKTLPLKIRGMGLCWAIEPAEEGYGFVARAFVCGPESIQQAIEEMAAEDADDVLEGDVDAADFDTNYSDAEIFEHHSGVRLAGELLAVCEDGDLFLIKRGTSPEVLADYLRGQDVTFNGCEDSRHG